MYSKIALFGCLGFGPSIKQTLYNTEKVTSLHRVDIYNTEKMTSLHREDRTLCKDVCVGKSPCHPWTGNSWHGPCARMTRKIEEKQTFFWPSLT